MVRSNGTTYSYDRLGRLMHVLVDGTNIHYVHDALGRRIGKVRDGNLEKGWLYEDALNPIAQLDENGELEATFLYGSRAHVPDAMVMTDGTVYRLITDRLGSVRLVVNAATGQVVQRIDYDAFGRVLSDTYAGRWTAKDAVLFNGGTAKFCEYAWNDPLNFVDADGTIPIAIWARAAALAFLESDVQFSGADLLGVTGIPGCGILTRKVTGRVAGRSSAAALSRAGLVLDRGGLTRAGRALAKHGGREGSPLPRPIGNPAAINQQGQAVLDDIVGNVSRTNPNRFGGLDYYGGRAGGGARFDAQGNFIGFLEP